MSRTGCLVTSGETITETENERGVLQAGHDGFYPLRWDGAIAWAWSARTSYFLDEAEASGYD